MTEIPLTRVLEIFVQSFLLSACFPVWIKINALQHGLSIA